MFVGVACHVGFSLVSSIWYSGNKQVDKGVQTDAWEDYSDRPSQIASDNLTSLNTMTPEISPSELVNSTSSDIGAQTITEGISPVTTVLPVRPVNIEVIPNPDIVRDTGIQTIPTEDATIITEMIPVFPDSSNIGGVANALDHFLATAWTPEKVSAMIDSMGLINNLFS